MHMQAPSMPQRTRLFQGAVQDPYRAPLKLHDPTVCPQCHAVFHKGRWQWLESWPPAALESLCQACCRIQDDYPAGWLRLKGGFVRAHRDEILGIARNCQKAENESRPLHRIMRIADQPDGLLITTTDIHLPRRIGETLRRAHKGRLALRYDVGGYSVRIDWTREAP